MYVSVSNKLEIRLTSRNKFHFLIKFESRYLTVNFILLFSTISNNTLQTPDKIVLLSVIGCPDIKQLPNAYIKRKENQVTIGCLTTTDKVK